MDILHSIGSGDNLHNSWHWSKEANQMIHFVTYSAFNMSISRKVCIEAGFNNGIDVAYEYTAANLSDEFLADNLQTLMQERGIGYWLWKAYIINKVIKMCKDEDVLIYCDAGVKLISNVNEIISRMDQDIFLFSNGHSHCHWCKADIMQGILGKQIEDSYEQVQASVIFFKVNTFTRRFIKEWLLYCQLPGWIDDSPSIIPNHREFSQNRYDQAILSTLAYKYSIRQHWWADAKWYTSQRYRWPGDKYPPMFIHHRYRNPGTGTGDIEWPQNELP